MNFWCRENLSGAIFQGEISPMAGDTACGREAGGTRFDSRLAWIVVVLQKTREQLGLGDRFGVVCEVNVANSGQERQRGKRGEQQQEHTNARTQPTPTPSFAEFLSRLLQSIFCPRRISW